MLFEYKYVIKLNYQFIVIKVEVEFDIFGHYERRIDLHSFYPAKGCYILDIILYIWSVLLLCQ